MIHSISLRTNASLFTATRPACAAAPFERLKRKVRASVVRPVQASLRITCYSILYGKSVTFIFHHQAGEPQLSRLFVDISHLRQKRSQNGGDDWM